MASRGFKNISLKHNVIAETLRRSQWPSKIKFQRRSMKDPMDLYKEGVGSRLPDAYFKWNRIGFKPPAIHWRDKGVDWEKDPETGDRRRVNRVPIPIHFPPESQMGLWGGEGWIVGKRKSGGDKGIRINKTWKPYIETRKFYSEILDRHFDIPTTNRVLDLIDEAYGFDFYILKTPAEELNSLLGMILKRHMLLHLATPEKIYPDDLEKRRNVVNKYKNYIIPKEEAEWVGLTPAEAFAKQRKIEEDANPIRPLQDVFTEELIAQYREHHGSGESDSLFTFTSEEEERSKPFLQKIFGSSSKSKNEDSSV